MAFGVASGADQFGELLKGPVYASRVTPTPLVTVVQSSNSLLLSWTIPSSRFVLQQNPDLSSTNWSELATSPIINYTNLQYEALIPRPEGTTFYRLMSQ